MGIILDCLFDGGNDRHSQLRKLFKHIDRNGNGVVTFDEFLTLETHLNKNSADAAKEFFKEFICQKKVEIQKLIALQKFFKL